MSIILEIIGWVLLLVVSYLSYMFGMSFPIGWGQREKPAKLFMRFSFVIVILAAVSKIFLIHSIWLAVGIWLVLGFILGYAATLLFGSRS